MRGVSIVMAGALLRDLHARGIRQVELGDCEAMIARMLDCTRVIEHRLGDEDAPRRCATDEVDLDGSCMACGAIRGEACQRPQGTRS